MRDIRDSVDGAAEPVDVVVTIKLPYVVLPGYKVRVRSRTPMKSVTDNSGNIYTRTKTTEFRCESLGAESLVATALFPSGSAPQYVEIHAVPPTLDFPDEWLQD